MNSADTHTTLTDKQINILYFLRWHYNKEGEMPSFKTVMRHFGFASTNAVTTHYQRLISKGVLRKNLEGHGSNRYELIEPTDGEEGIKIES